MSWRKQRGVKWWTSRHQKWFIRVRKRQHTVIWNHNAMPQVMRSHDQVWQVLVHWWRCTRYKVESGRQSMSKLNRKLCAHARIICYTKRCSFVIMTKKQFLHAKFVDIQIQNLYYLNRSITGRWDYYESFCPMNCHQLINLINWLIN